MTTWRVAVLIVLLFLIGLPLLVPFGDLLGNPLAWNAFKDTPRLLGLAGNTALLVAGTLALAVPAGVLGAFLLYRTDLPLNGWWRFLIILSLFVPLPLFTAGWQAALGSHGWLPVLFRPEGSSTTAPPSLVGILWGQGMLAAIWIHALAALPWVVLLVGQGLRWVERELEEDALTVAGSWRVFFGVTLRRALAALGAASLWVALQTATEITVTDMLQVRTFAEEVYTQYVTPESGILSADLAVAQALAVSVPPILLTLALVLATALWWEKNLPPLQTVTTTPYLFHLGKARGPALLLVGSVALFLVGIPVIGLVWKLGLAGSPLHWTLETALVHLENVFRARSGFVASSLLWAGVAGGLTGLLALVACWLAVGSRWFFGVLVLLTALAWSVPGPVVGLGLKGLIQGLMDLDRSGLVGRLLYYGPSPAPVLWVDLIRFFPCAVAVLWPVVRLLPPDLRDAARTDGLGPWQELRYLTWPLAARDCVRAGLVIAILSLGELSAGKLLETPGTATFSHFIFTLLHSGVTNDLAALCLVMLTAVVVGGMGVAFLRVRHREDSEPIS